MAESLTKDGLVASWKIGEVTLVELGGEEKCAHFSFGHFNGSVVMEGLAVEFIKKLSGSLYKKLDVQIIVSNADE